MEHIQFTLVHESAKGKKYAIANSPTSWAWVLEPGAVLCMQHWFCARFFPSTVMPMTAIFASTSLSAVLSFELPQLQPYTAVQRAERLFWKYIIQTSSLYSIFPLVLYDSNIYTLSSSQSQHCSVVSVNLSSLNSLYSYFTSKKDSSDQFVF